MVAGIAAQSAIAIENARLYQERTRTAQTLQRALLPPHLPQIAGPRAGRGLPRRGRGQRGRRRLLRRLPAGRRELGAGRRRRLRQGPAGRRGDRARPLHAARPRRRRAAPELHARAPQRRAAAPARARLRDRRAGAPGAHRRAARTWSWRSPATRCRSSPATAAARAGRRGRHAARDHRAAGAARGHARARAPATCSPSTPTASPRPPRRKHLLDEDDLAALVAERAPDGPGPVVGHLERDRGRARRRQPARRHRLPRRAGHARRR